MLPKPHSDQMCDVLIVGAGPAGSLAALLLARQGARVRLVDRSRFPRDKLCGDTLNPGALAVLARHVDIRCLEERALALDGMVLTGPRGVSVRGRYGRGLVGRALTRRELDEWLLQQALAAGVQFEEAVTVTGAAIETRRGHRSVAGVGVRMSNGKTDVLRAPLVIGADGRRSALAASIDVSRQPRRPRRWAVGAYFEQVDGLERYGEMHVRHGHYIGVAPMPGGLANACFVEPIDGHARGWSDPGARLRDALASDPALGPRFARARLVSKPIALGPMAMDVSRPGATGMLLAGDAAGFIDPMTGDGLRYALAGAELAAAVAADVLAGTLDPAAAPGVLEARRRNALAAKWRFNRALRQAVSWSAAVSTAAVVARAAPFAFEALIRYAGDCHAETPQMRRYI